MKYFMIFVSFNQDNVSIITPIILHFCCPYLGILIFNINRLKKYKYLNKIIKDELQNLMIKFSTGVKRFEQKIQDASNFFSFENQNQQINDFSYPRIDPQKIQVYIFKIYNLITFKNFKISI